MSLERVPADIRKQGGVARMTDPKVLNNCIFTVLVLHLIIKLIIKICSTLATIYLVSYFTFESFYSVVENKRNHECCHNPSDG